MKLIKNKKMHHGIKKVKALKRMGFDLSAVNSSKNDLPSEGYTVPTSQAGSESKLHLKESEMGEEENESDHRQRTPPSSTRNFRLRLIRKPSHLMMIKPLDCADPQGKPIAYTVKTLTPM